MTLRRSVQSIGSLATFEAAARLGGFTLAASELGVSQAAVSRQIKALETDLGTPLFLRAHRRVTLTPAGEALAAVVTKAFAEVAEAVDTLRHPTAPGTVTIGASLAFSHFWLLPRLPAFRAAHPGIRLRLVAEDGASDLRRDRLDMAVRYGNPPFEGAITHASLPDQVYAVCSPGFYAAHALGPPERLSQVPILASDWLDPTWLTWRQWARAAGLGPDLGRSSDLSHLRFNHYTDTVQAAVDGQGLALGWAQVLAGHLADGRLVHAGGPTVTPVERHHLILPADRAPSSAAGQVLDWLRAGFAAPYP
jgi:DNA-binding transcriptional LysR family regulator